MDFSHLWQHLLFASQCLYMICLLPQVFTNYRVKSGKGLSDLFIVGYLNGHFAQLFYVFCLGLPLGYKIFVPIQFSVVMTIIFQRLYYERFSERNQLAFYAANIIIAGALVPIAYRLPELVGTISGWAALIIFSLSQLPQLFKVYATRSVQGFSIMFIVVMGVGSFFELSGSLGLGLPLQTLFNALRNCLFVVGCLGAFCLYGNLCSTKLPNQY